MCGAVDLGGFGVVEVCLGVFVLRRVLRCFELIRCSTVPELLGGTSEYCGNLGMKGLGK